jgi:hypothetical protein
MLRAIALALRAPVAKVFRRCAALIGCASRVTLDIKGHRRPLQSREPHSSSRRIVHFAGTNQFTLVSDGYAKKLRCVLTEAPVSQSIRNPGGNNLHVFVTKPSEGFQSQYEGSDVPARSVLGAGGAYLALLY